MLPTIGVDQSFIERVKKEISVYAKCNLGKLEELEKKVT